MIWKLVGDSFIKQNFTLIIPMKGKSPEVSSWN